MKQIRFVINIWIKEEEGERLKVTGLLEKLKKLR